MKAALLLVDIQNDFLPGGSLAVPRGNEILPVANQLMQDFDHVIATQDWHPSNHGSFAANHVGAEVGTKIELDGLEQILWPVHCVQNSPGADFSSELDRDKIAHVVQKGTNPLVDSYSGFFDNARRQATGLEDYLREQSIDQLHLIGLATDYCVKFTALDAVDLGFKTILHESGVRGVNLNEGDSKEAIKIMANAGVEIVD